MAFGWPSTHGPCMQRCLDMELKELCMHYVIMDTPLAYTCIDASSPNMAIIIACSATESISSQNLSSTDATINET